MIEIYDNLIISQHPINYDTNIIIRKGDISSLHKLMEKYCFDKKDIRELIAIVKSEKPDIESRQLGEKVNNWILKVFEKTLNGVGKINREVTAYSLAISIKQYYGIAD